MEFCANPQCRAPLDRSDSGWAIDDKRKLCDLCMSMYAAVYAREFFKAAQQEFESEKRNLDRLRPGRNYLE